MIRLLMYDDHFKVSCINNININNQPSNKFSSPFGLSGVFTFREKLNSDAQKVMDGQLDKVSYKADVQWS